MFSLDPTHPIVRLAREDARYRIDAYMLVFESLNYAQNHLNMGGGQAAEEFAFDVDENSDEDDDDDDESVGEMEATDAPERHVTGQELCEAIRMYALDQYGYMAKSVLNSWGIHSTSDFGELVYNMIGIGHMRKTEQDRREDFNDVFDFDEGLIERFKITMPESQ